MMYGNRVLKMRSGQLVTSNNAPLIRKHIQLGRFHRYHWFDSKTHPVFKLLSRTLLTVIRYLGIFVHRTTNAVTDKFANNAVTLGFAMLLDSITDIA